MPVTPVRRAAPAAGTSRAPAAAARPVSSGYRGAVGIAKMEEEQVNAAARKEAAQMNANMPFRFYCEAGGPSKEVVVVDYTINEVFFRWEHNLKDKRDNKWSIFCACINESENCPVCTTAERPSYFVMMLTVIDLTPYTSSRTNVTVEWSKKLLPVKSAQQKKITRLASSHDGNLRGMILRMTRDGDKDAQIGNDIEFVEFMSEEDLLTYEMVYEYESQGKQKEKLIVGHEPFDYDELFPMPTSQQLRAIVGGSPDAGSREADRDTRGARGSRAAGGGDGWDGNTAGRAPAPARRGAPTPAPAARPIARRAAPAPAPEPEQEELTLNEGEFLDEATGDIVDAEGNILEYADGTIPEAVEEEAPPPPAPAAVSRTRTVTATARPAARPVARRTAAAQIDPDDMPDAGADPEADAAPAPRRAAPPQRPPARPTTRAAAPDPEAETPQRVAAGSSLAARRQALRRG